MRTVPRLVASVSMLAACAYASGAAHAAEPTRKGDLLSRARKGPLSGAREVVFAARGIGEDPHWYANFGYWSSDPERTMYAPGGGLLAKLDLESGKVTDLVHDPGGSVRDPVVHYDGKTILFSYRPEGTRQFHLYEIQSDGSGLRQITSGPYDDFEPAYLPCGDIVFASSRCRRWVACWHTQVAILYRASRDGTGIRPISSNNEQDNTPAVLPDGRILYTRWEYIDRNQVTFHHLWTLNPDGTGQMVLYGNQHPGIVMIDAEPIPGSDKVAAIFSPGHGRKEHVGDLTVVDPRAGPDAKGEARRVPGCPPHVRDPHPLGGGWFLVARGRDLVLVDASSRRHEVIYSLGRGARAPGLELHEPAPLRERPREPVIADRTDRGSPTGRLVLQDVYNGRNMDGVKRGDIRELLVIESLPKPVNFSGGPEQVSWLGTFTLERALGTVPVEADGSAYLEIPADRPVFFVALDERRLSVKRMQSFVSVAPGETTSCVGCHEQRSRVPQRRAPSVVQAIRRPPSRIEPIPGVPPVVDFLRDIQPVLDRHCVPCHNYDRREGRAVLTGDLGIRFAHSYWTLISRNQVADGHNGFGNRAPRAIGSSASQLLEKIDEHHHDVALSPEERTLVWLWLETGAPFAGTYAALTPEPLPPPGRVFRAAADVLHRRCFGCHAAPGANDPRKPPLPAAPKSGPVHQRVFTEDDPAARLAVQVLFNLTRPEKSPLILGPLAADQGGYGSCRPVGGPTPDSSDAGRPVFRDTADPAYRVLLEAVRQLARQGDPAGEWHRPEFRPNIHYVREMQRFGILPVSFDPARDPIDVYETDLRYWESLWFRPAPAEARRNDRPEAPRRG